MDEVPHNTPSFPEDLLKWAGHHSGGVKRLFDEKSGRPGQQLLWTTLIGRLETWAIEVAAGNVSAPRILLLVGGPGNGKTEAIEHTINCLDRGLCANGAVVRNLSAAFHPIVGNPVPRVIEVDVGILASPAKKLKVTIVQDASVIAGHEGQTAAELLVEELLAFLDAPSDSYYLCCVNRGVLDDALIHALEKRINKAQHLLETITRSVSLTPLAPPCWPLEGLPCVAIWPMDVESLLTSYNAEYPAAAAALLAHATNPEFWRTAPCPAGDACPYCSSQKILNDSTTRKALIQLLRWYELASGKRWSFRDLFTLVSYLLAGHRPTGQGALSPCQWAQHLSDQDKNGQLVATARRDDLSALYQLVAQGYQHALFHAWDSDAAGTIKTALKELGLPKEASETRTILGLQYFLQDRKQPYLPATIASLLESLCELLDPAFAHPESVVALNARTTVSLGDLDNRFSRSIANGLEFVEKLGLLSVSERLLVSRLTQADNLLSSSTVRRKNPAAANRLQQLLRDFSCRLVRRSVCTRFAIVPDSEILIAFQNIVDHDDKQQGLFEAAQQVKALLNNGPWFEVSLATTFGQPLPPAQRQATLVVAARSVRPRPPSAHDRPRSPLCFLSVGAGQSTQPIALTFDLFKAVKELDRGLSPASLPRTVVALLDATKAMLAGPIVRDPDVLMDSRIRLGVDGAGVRSSWDGFLPDELQERA